MNKKYYAAYGSNLNMSLMKRHCREAEIIGTAQLDGYQLALRGEDGNAYFTIEEKEGSSVPLGIWAISEKDEEKLDQYEDFPELYRKEIIKLNVKKMGRPSAVGCCMALERKKEVYEELDCLIYIMNGAGNYGKPSKKYMRECETGYACFGFDMEKLAKAVK